MSAARTLYLDSEHANERWHRAKEFVRELLAVSKSVRVRIDEKQPTRSIEQNERFHAICCDLAKSTPWGGKMRDTEAWKRLLVDAWSRTNNGVQCEVVPSLDGSSVVMLGIQTRSLRVGEMSDLIEFAQWWCAEHGVRLAA